MLQYFLCDAKVAKKQKHTPTHLYLLPWHISEEMWSITRDISALNQSHMTVLLSDKWEGDISVNHINNLHFWVFSSTFPNNRWHVWVIVLNKREFQITHTTFIHFPFTDITFEWQQRWWSTWNFLGQKKSILTLILFNKLLD